MRLFKARVQNYRSIRDTEEFEVEGGKTIFVGPNEAGKSAILRALQQIKPTDGVPPFDPIRDYPRALYNDISTNKAKASKTPVATAVFQLEDEDKCLLPEQFRDCKYSVTRFLDNHATGCLIDAPRTPTFADIRKDLLRLAAHIDGRSQAVEGETATITQSAHLKSLTEKWSDGTLLDGERFIPLRKWLDEATVLIDENDRAEEARLGRLASALSMSQQGIEVLNILGARTPVFVYYSNYFRVRPNIQLDHLADRLEKKLLDDDQYDYGNFCLLQLLGFSARELSDLGKANEPLSTRTTQRQQSPHMQFIQVTVPVPTDEYQAALKAYRDQLDNRYYQLNAASVKLTESIRQIWNPTDGRAEANTLRISADGQYLKVVVVDDLGVEIELDQRSEGFQWLVSFFVVFFAEAMGDRKNAILLLDEPGTSLHALKQKEFRKTLSLLAKDNQTILTTHSPFLVGPDELDLVRVVEMTNRSVGTKVHTSVTTTDPAAILPLQEALGYDLGQSLFHHSRNLVLEGLTDEWYLEAVSELLAEAGIVKLDDQIALIPANAASKVVYFATFLHANALKVAALLDSDAAGDEAAKQDVLVHKLGSKGILRTKDFLASSVAKAEIEDLLRETLIKIAKDKFGWDVAEAAVREATRPIVDVFTQHAEGFKKYKLAKEFVRWARDHSASDLTETERGHWKKLIRAINGALK